MPLYCVKDVYEGMIRKIGWDVVLLAGKHHRVEEFNNLLAFKWSPADTKHREPCVVGPRTTCIFRNSLVDFFSSSWLLYTDYPLSYLGWKRVSLKWLSETFDWIR